MILIVMAPREEEQDVAVEEGLDTNTQKQSRHSKKTKETQKELSDNLFSQAKKREKEFAQKYAGKTEDEIVKIFEEENPDEYKGKSFDDILVNLHGDKKWKDGKPDKALQNRDLHDRLKDNIGKKPEKTEEEQTEIDSDEESKDKKKPNAKKEKDKSPKKENKEDKIEEKKQQLLEEEKSDKKNLNDAKNAPETKDETAKSEVTPLIEDDQDKKSEEGEWKKKKDKKEKKEKGEKKEKKWWFRRKTGRAIAWPFRKLGQAAKWTGKTARKIGKWTVKSAISLGKWVLKTARTPVGLTSYLLSDIWIKDKSKRTGRKDRWAGYKKHRAWTKKSK